MSGWYHRGVGRRAADDEGILLYTIIYYIIPHSRTGGEIKKEEIKRGAF